MTDLDRPPKVTLHGATWSERRELVECEKRVDRGIDQTGYYARRATVLRERIAETWAMLVERGLG